MRVDCEREGSVAREKPTRDSSFAFTNHTSCIHINTTRI